MNEKFVITTTDESIRHLKKKDKRLAVIIDKIGDIECSCHEDPFSFVVEEIVGQMLSNKVADVICARLYALCNGEITPDSLLPVTISDLRSIGISNAKSEYILLFSDAVRSGRINLDMLPGLSDAEVMKELMSLRGVGSWTAKMYLIFVLRREDVLPFEDGAFMQSYKWLYGKDKPTKDEIIARGKRWSPYASIAARYLYRALDMGFTKERFTKVK